MSREVALVGVLVFAMIAIGGLSAAYQTSVQESQPTQHVINESFSPVNDTVVVLDESRRDVVYNGSDDVRVYQNRTEINSTGNWTWHAGDGTISINATSTFNESRLANVSYNYTIPAAAQQTARDVALVPYLLGDGLGIIVGAALIVGAIALLGRQA